MTIQQLEKMGIVYLNTKLHPNRFFVPSLGNIDIDFRRSTKEVMTEIFSKIYEAGRSHAIEYGKQLKINEIKSILDIDYE